ncbi:MAG: hypothetical protein A4E19_18550 [Nitrospira sp. SG-bin1]|nr:MAG: hypothetical protein A4E19_18550 [Nitrospira sp. SG-bin1]
MLGTLIVEGGFLLSAKGSPTPPVMDWKIIFFIFVPLGLALLIWRQLRWAPAVCVFYATVGLAMDIATIVQVLAQDSEGVASMMASGISGLFYLCLIVFGGRSFLYEEQGPMPPEALPPSPPSLS